MLSSSDFLEIVSGRRRSLSAVLCRAALRCAEVPYGAAVRLRNLAYDRGWKQVRQVDAPVISIGNLTAGGTGKTPMVEWLGRWYRHHGVRVVIISRGYGAEAGARNDEALELERKLPDVPHLQNPDRVEAAETAIEEFESQLILLDDAFQHRRIHRDLDVVLVDALSPFGFRHLLPRGLLREPMRSLQRADTIALSRADLVSDSDRNRILDAIRDAAPNAVLVTISHQPTAWLQWSGVRRTLDTLKGRQVAAFCGIGNPEGFRMTLEKCGVQLAAFKIFPDHYPFKGADLESLAEWAQSAQAHAIVCTAKDLVKLRVDDLGGMPLWSLEIGIEFGKNQAGFEQQLSEVHAHHSAR